MFEIPFEHNWYLNIHSDRKINSPPIAHFIFSKVVKGKSKYKKGKLQCSQNVDLNPTYAIGRHYDKQEKLYLFSLYQSCEPNLIFTEHICSSIEFRT